MVQTMTSVAALLATEFQDGQSFAISSQRVRDLIVSLDIPWVAAGGTPDAITATYTNPMTAAALVNGKLCAFSATAANATAAPTFNPSALGTNTITKNGGQPLAAGDIFGAGHECLLRFHAGTATWELLNPALNTNDPWIVAGGTANAITATFAPAVLALTDGMRLSFRAIGANSVAAPTFSPNGLPAHPITKSGGTALAIGDIPGALAESILRYNLANTRWELLNPAVSGGLPWAVAGGVADVITAAYTPPIAALTDGLLLTFRASAANATATPSFNPNSLGANTITKKGGAALSAGDIAGALNECLVRYNLAHTRWELLNPASAATLQNPQVTVLSTGSGTYTTPVGALYLDVEMVGAGGGGAAGNMLGDGTGAGNTTFGTSLLSAGGGAGGKGSAGNDSGGAGGTSSGGDMNAGGAAGIVGGQSFLSTFGGAGGAGGNSIFGGGGTSGGNIAGGNAAANTGSGGGGGGVSAAVTNNGGGGGGAGAYCQKLITSPLVSYPYAVGAGGAGHAGGTNGSAGGNGADGLIIVIAHFQ